MHPLDAGTLDMLEKKSQLVHDIEEHKHKSKVA
jgi:hypothetical protein